MGNFGPDWKCRNGSERNPSAMAHVGLSRVDRLSGNRVYPLRQSRKGSENGPGSRARAAGMVSLKLVRPLVPARPFALAEEPFCTDRNKRRIKDVAAAAGTHRSTDG